VSRPYASKVRHKPRSCRYWVVMFILATVWAVIASYSAWSFSKIEKCDYTKYDDLNKDYICVIVLEDM
jgi:hypothetical protein